MHIFVGCIVNIFSTWMSISTLNTFWSSHKWVRVSTYILTTTTVICLIIGILINAFLGPRQLTPLALMYAKDYLDADVEIESVEATFFSSFPKLRIRANNAQIVSRAFHTLPTDTIISRRDTLFRVEVANIGFDMHKLLQGEFVIGYLSLENPTIRVVTDVLGRRNWNILKEDSVATEETDTVSVTDYLSMEHIRVKNARLAYIDVPNNKSFFANKIDAVIDGNLTMNSLSADIDISDKTTTLRYDGTQFFHRMPVKMDGHIDCESFNQYKLSDFHAMLGEISLDVDGDIKIVEDSSYTIPPLDFNLTYKLSSPELSTVFDLVPKEYIEVPLDIETGNVKFDGSVKGIYTANNYPQFHTFLEIDSVKARYQGMREKIEDLSVKAKMSIDDVDPDSSYIHMDILHFQGGKSELTASAFMDRMFSDPKIKAKINGHIDLKSMLDIFPIKGMEMDGLVDAQVGGAFTLSDIQNHNYGNIIVGGKVTSDKISIKLAMPGDTITVTDSTIIAGASELNPIRYVSAPDTFNLQTDIDIKFLGKDTVRTVGRVKRMRMVHPHIRLSVRNMEASTKTYKSKTDTNEIANAWADVKAGKFLVRLDSVIIAGSRIHNVSTLRPSKADKYIPYLENNLDADTIMLSAFGTRSMSRRLGMSMAFERVTDTTWHSNGRIESKEIRVKTPAFALPIQVSDIKILQKERTFDFKNVTLRTGKSTMNLNGQMHNLYYSLKAKQPFNATFNVKSDTLDINELMSAVVEDVAKHDMEKTMDESSMDIGDVKDRVEIDSAKIQQVANQLVYISKRIRFSLKTDINTLLWSNFQLKKVKANVELANRTLHLTNFMFNQGKGKVVSTLSYKPSRRRKNAQVDWFMRWERADIQELVQASGMDTIMPMLQPLRGLVDCYMATKLTIDSTLTPDLSTAKVSAHIGAQKVTLLDGDTFARISKMLMFKNKKVNIIDTLSFNVLIDSGKIEIPPFVMSMDRYRACIGGSQDLDMNLKYHVSILKSPLPFKAGVDIKGTPDKLDYDITTAKLKKYATDAIQAENDAKSLAIRLDILRHSYTLSGLQLPDQLKTQEEREKEKIDNMLKEDKTTAGTDKLGIKGTIADLDSISATKDTSAVSTNKPSAVVNVEKVTIGK